MNRIIINLFLLGCVLFVYIFVYSVSLNILLFLNKDIIEKQFKNLRYKLYVYDNSDNGKPIPRKKRIIIISEMIKQGNNIRGRKLFAILLKLYNSLQVVISLLLIFLLVFIILFNISHRD